MATWTRCQTRRLLSSFSSVVSTPTTGDYDGKPASLPLTTPGPPTTDRPARTWGFNVSWKGWHMMPRVWGTGKPYLHTSGVSASVSSSRTKPQHRSNHANVPSATTGYCWIPNPTWSVTSRTPASASCPCGECSPERRSAQTSSRFSRGASSRRPRPTRGRCYRPFVKGQVVGSRPPVGCHCTKWSKCPQSGPGRGGDTAGRAGVSPQQQCKQEPGGIGQGTIAEPGQQGSYCADGAAQESLKRLIRQVKCSCHPGMDDHPIIRVHPAR